LMNARRARNLTGRFRVRAFVSRNRQRTRGEPGLRRGTLLATANDAEVSKLTCSHAGKGLRAPCTARLPPIAFDRTMTTLLVICSKTLSFLGHWAGAAIDFGGFHPMFRLKQPESTRGSPACC
jgi:hypothetical protein